MTTTLAKDATLDRVGSHSVNMGVIYRDGIAKEGCYGYFSATWRGQPVRVTVSADRYRHSSGLSEWRVYARDAREIDPNDQRNTEFYYHGPDVSGTARQRLGEICVPVMREWLDSDAYTASRQGAFVRMFRNLGRELTTYGDPPSRDLRRALDKFAHELTTEQAAAVIAVADTFDAYAAALESLGA